MDDGPFSSSPPPPPSRDVSHHAPSSASSRQSSVSTTPHYPLGSEPRRRPLSHQQLPQHHYQEREEEQQRSRRASTASSTYSHSASRASLARASVPSFSAFRSQAPGVPTALKQRPSQTTSHHAPSSSLSSLSQGSPRVAEPAPRPLSVDGRSQPRPSNGGLAISLPTLAEQAQPRQRVRSSYAFPLPGSAHERTVSIDSRITSSDSSQSFASPRRTSSIPIHLRYASGGSIANPPDPSLSHVSSTSETQRPDRAASDTTIGAPAMTPAFHSPQRTLSNGSDPLDTGHDRSPASRIGNLFGWKSASSKAGSEPPSTPSSERSMSLLPSPNVEKPLPGMAVANGGPVTPPNQVSKNGRVVPSYFDHPDVPILAGSPENLTHVKELERELALVSEELAASIRREMDLEDDLDRIRLEGPSAAPSDSGRRGSDYFSDSGASSVRFPITDYDSKLEQLERTLRKSEQEKANIKLDMASRLQAELSRRRDLEQMVQSYEEQLQRTIDSHSERDGIERRAEELESTLEDTRRLLSQERQAKDSFEDLYSATREELERHKNESDNLRDEVVPQLKAQVEGLEGAAAQKEALTYENARMQQELSAMRETLEGRYGFLAEENNSATPRSNIGRSSSVVRGHGSRGGSINRSGSVRDGARPRSGSLSTSGPVTAEGMKEVEDQRDALHVALRLMISRHEKQRRDHERAIRKLTMSRDRAQLESAGVARSPYRKEVAYLKDEVATLRKRTEDALEQKYQYEKNLAGVKMDLDSAEQETRGLRALLQQPDILAADTNGAPSFDADGDRRSASPLGLPSVETERNAARVSASQFRASAAQASDAAAPELLSCAARMDSLAEQLDAQALANSALRARLTAAVAVGEAEQRTSSGRIADAQKRLANLEDEVLAAQLRSETSLGSHEADVRDLDEAAASPWLQRVALLVTDTEPSGPTAASKGRLTAPSSPNPMLISSPKIGSGEEPAPAVRTPLLKPRPRTAADHSLLDASATPALERGVRALERALRDADSDVQEVLQRVHAGHAAVHALQAERDAAVARVRDLVAAAAQVRASAPAL